MKKTIYFILKIIIVLLLITFSLLGIGMLYCKSYYIPKDSYAKNAIYFNSITNKNTINDKNGKRKDLTRVELPGERIEIITEIDDWRLILVNSENPLPETFSIELAQVNGAKEFDARAANELMELLQDMKASGASNIWIQSAYRTPEYQDNLYQNKVQDFIIMGKSRQDAEILASRWVNKSETSEHNLGLAVDFNNVKRDFENTKEFAWLVENAENYGFILRYKKEKQDITKVNYEPWHWRYVGTEHAREINRLDMCLEEYIEYLKDKNKKSINP